MKEGGERGRERRQGEERRRGGKGGGGEEEKDGEGWEEGGQEGGEGIKVGRMEERRNRDEMGRREVEEKREGRKV